MIRYANLKPGKEPYTSPFRKTDPFKTKLYAVQNLAMMYSTEEQKEDKQRREKEGVVESNSVDIMTPKTQSIWQLQDLGRSSSGNTLTCSSKKLEKVMEIPQAAEVGLQMELSEVKHVSQVDREKMSAFQAAKTKKDSER